MKSLRFLLPLLAALLVSVGFFLPWMGAARLFFRAVTARFTSSTAR